MASSKFGVMLIQGEDDSNICNHLTLEFAEGFKALGYKTQVSKLPYEINNAELYSQLSAIDCGLIISLAGMELDHIRSVCDTYKLDTPVFTMYLDPVNIYWDRIIYRVPNSYIGALSAQDARFIEQYAQDKKKAFQLNHAALIKVPLPWHQKDIDLFYCASLPSLPEVTRASWAKHGKGVEKILNHIVDLHMQGSGQNLLAEIVTVLNTINVPYTLDHLNNFFGNVDRYLRDKRRVDTLRKIASETPVLLAGNGWESIVEDDTLNINYLGRIHPTEVRDYNMRSKMVLNVINQYHETHERVFSTMADGSVVLSSSSPFYKTAFNNTQGCFFEWQDNTLNERIRTLLNNDNALEELAHNGTCAFKEKHTWTHRAQTVLDHIFPNAGSTTTATPS